MAETVRSRSLAAGGCFFLTTCAGFLRPELNYQFVERPDDDVIWGSPLPEILGGARSRNQPITEGPSADPGLEVARIEVMAGGQGGSPNGRHSRPVG